MEDLLIEILESFGYPVRLQGSLLEDEPYPDHFFTFWNNDSTGHFYDNDETHTTYDYSVYVYSIDPERVYSLLREAKKKLKQNNFIVSGDGYGVASDEPTHDGRGIRVQYLRRN